MDNRFSPTEFPECFDGIGELKGMYHITLDPEVEPVINSPCRVPIALKDEIKAELASMEHEGVIEKVQEGQPTDWVNSIVYQRKSNGKLQICLDPRDLNTAIKREHHVTPTLEDIIPKMSGAKFFSTVDAKCGYWNVRLDEQSSFLTTFNSPYGRYRFKRMPFGLKMSQDIFQARIDQLVEGLAGVVAIADEIVIFGATQEEHDENLRRLLARCREHGLKLNPDKSQISQPEVKFYGIICSAEGVRPDPRKVSALQTMSAPTSSQELASFLGLATYMGPFIPNLSSLAAPLRALTRKDAVFEWSPAAKESFDKIKQAVSDSTTLSYFDVRKPVVLQVDASMKALGAALIQDGKPVAFASKALSPAESRYANIERELLAVVYGCERFHNYLFGRPFTVESDHKPLASIHLKHLNSSPARLRRMLMRLQPYDLKIVYQPGAEMYIADALSRLSGEDQDEIADLDVTIHEISSQFTSSLLEEIRTATDEDDELRSLKDVIYVGWPQSRSDVHRVLLPYWNFRDELTIDNGIVTKGTRIVIPRKIRSRILAQLHLAHQGVEKTRLHARTAVYWPGIYDDIEQMVKACSICQEAQPQQPKEPMIPADVPPRAWHTVGADLFYSKGTEYLLVSDYYSKFPFVRRLPAKCTSAAVVLQLKQIFSEQGIPQIVRTDNGPQFNSKEFSEFSSVYGFKHVTSSPHYPRSNGFIESQVKIVKRTLEKVAKDNSDPHLALLYLRSTPVDSKLPSPAQLLQHRSFMDTLPKIPSKGDDNVLARLEDRQHVHKSLYDQHAKAMEPLRPGQPVSVLDPTSHTWKPATVRTVCDEPRSYAVVTSAGNEVRRNRAHLKERQPERQPGEKPTPAAAATAESSSEVVASSSTDSSPSSTDATTSQPMTRSGRVVKAPQKLNL